MKSYFCYRSILIATLLLSALNSSAANLSPKIEGDIFMKTAALATTPRNAANTNEDWSVLKKYFPKLTWKINEEGTERTAQLARGITVTAKGARTMVNESELSITSHEAVLLALLKKNAHVLAERCDSQERASYMERYLMLEFAGYKPINAIYELSSGSGGVTESIKFSNSVTLPRPGTQASEGSWNVKCG